MILDIIFFIAIVSNLIFTLVVVFNFLSPINLKKINQDKIQPEEKISILVPLRNEEENVENCLKSIYNQKLENFEVICLDDNSTDKTFEKLKNLQKQYKHLKTLKGAELPNGWTGKNWACYQLANHSIGDYLLFVDADVRLSEEAVSTAISEMKRLNVSMLSVFPTQIIKSIGEYFIVPSMNWLLLTFLPLRFVYKFSHPSFVAANGQFIVFKREDYFKIGGHFSVHDKVVEDMELARLMKKNGFKIVTYLGGKLIFARMYKNFEEALNGFSKNFYLGFRTGYFQFIILLIFISVVFISPFLFLFFQNSFLLIVGLIIIQKFLISIKSYQKLHINLLLLPFQLILVVAIGIRSMLLTKKGKLTWKGRSLKAQN